MSSSIIVPRDVWKLIIDTLEPTIAKDATFVIRDSMKNFYFVKLKDITTIKFVDEHILNVMTSIYNDEGGYESYNILKDCNPILFDLLTKWLSTVYIL